MKKRSVLLLILGLAIVLVTGNAFSSERTFKVGVTVIVNHPALDGVQKGFEAALSDAGVKVKYEYQNAQGDMSNAQLIAQKFESDNTIDLVHAIATPTSQAACKSIKNKPIVYDAVTDPVGAGLVKTMGPDGGNVTGVSDAWDIDLQISTYAKYIPNAKRWGTVYNAGDQNSVKSVSWTREAMKKLGMKLVEVTISTSSEVYEATNSLVGRVDAIYITSDNIAVTAFESITKVAQDNNIPLFAGDTGSVPRGAIMALGYNYFKTGYAGGKKAVQILRDGKKPGDIPSTMVADIEGILEFHLSLANAKAQGFKVSPELIEQVRSSGGKIYE